MNDICAIFLILGSIIGAGFATGKELVVFYVQYGVYGIVGVFLSCVLFSIIFYKYLVIKRNKKQNKAFTIIICICYIIISGGLVGACDEICDRLFDINFNIVGLITLVVVGLLTLCSIDKLSKICFCIVPVLIAITLIISVQGVLGYNSDIGNKQILDNNIIGAILYSGLYVGINTIMSSKILFDIDNVKNKKFVSVMSSIVFGVIVLVVSVCLFFSGEEVISSSVPMYILASRVGYIWQYLYLVSLWFAIISSLISTIYGIQSELVFLSGNKNVRILITIVVCYITSLMGFENIVSIIYPIIGGIGLVHDYLLTQNSNV